MKHFRHYLTVITAFILIACNFALFAPPGEKAAPEGGEEVSPKTQTFKTKKLASKAVSPSDEEQILQLDEITVRLSPGAILESGELRISKVTNKVDLPIKDAESAGIFEVLVEGQENFGAPIILEFPVNLEELNPGLPANRQAAAAYWDVEGNHWVSVPAVVDASRAIASVETTHLSVWSFIYYSVGYETDPTEHFIFLYDKKEVLKFKGNHQSLTNNTRSSLPEYITDLMDCMEKEYAVYDRLGYPFPDPPILVHVGNYTDPELVTITGDVRLPYDLNELDDMRQTTAHELFHVIQLKTLTTPAYSPLQWWMDATADYAADMVAWESVGGTGLMGQDITARWLEKSINASDKHAYGTSRFVEYLLKQPGMGDFKALWYASIADITKIIDNIDAFVQKRNDTSLAIHYTNYAADFIFNPVGPCKRCGEAYADIATNRTPWDVDHGAELKNSFSVNYYAAKTWGIRNQVKDRFVKIERLDGNLGSVSVYTTPDDQRSFSVSTFVDNVFANRPITLKLKKTDYLFIILTNSEETSPQEFIIRVSETEEPQPVKYQLFLKFAEGECGSTAASGVARAFVTLEGEKASLSYESSRDDNFWAPGAEHTVSTEGGGRILTKTDKTGVVHTYLELQFSGVDQLGSGGRIQLEGKVMLWRNPDNPTYWVAVANPANENQGWVTGGADVQVPPHDDFPGLSCYAELVNADMYPVPENP